MLILSKIKRMTPEEFYDKWGNPELIDQLTERQAAQTHFNDICALVDHGDPIAFGQPDIFSFEAKNIKPDGNKGWADAYYQNRFIWEYKGPHGNLHKAYQQLLLYKDELGNPPLLITCDLQTIIIHANYTNTVRQSHEITLERLVKRDGLELLQRVFHAPRPEFDEFFKPKQTKEHRTLATAEAFVKVANSLGGLAKREFPHYTPEQQAHFLIRLLFCLFAENIGLLPDKLLTAMVSIPQPTTKDTTDFLVNLSHLFQKMRQGGHFGRDKIQYFNGALFDDATVPPTLTSDIVESLRKACQQDWSQLEPSIFGTLFERVLNEAKRKQLGAHYTSRDDILLIVYPILMKPLREKWQTLKFEAESGLRQGQSAQINTALQQFAQEIAQTTVLDPACGSGNFLYVALRELLDLQKEVITFARRHDLDLIPLTVSPSQLYGLEIDIYAHELAQITVWIGYIQWRFENGLENMAEPILQPLQNVRRMDAILAYDEQGQPINPTWPPADIVIGNPPFLGHKKMRQMLEHDYIEALFKLYQNRLPHEADLVCYWFEKARALIAQGQLKRAGLLSTQAIRAGVNRYVLEQIKITGNIFMGWSDREWVLEGAAVRISMIGFDNGTEQEYQLDGQPVAQITANLSENFDLSQVKILAENKEIAFMGDIKVGSFEITNDIAQQMLKATNPSGRSNDDVIRRWMNGTDIASRPRNMWIIDFGVDMSQEEAALYELPFEHVRQHVQPSRVDNRMKKRAEKWWIHGDAAPRIRKIFATNKRYLVIPRVAKYRLFVWLDNTVLPDSRLQVFARDDDYFAGVLNSRVHEAWAIVTTSRHGDGNTPTYNINTCFETFPFPWSLGTEPSESENPTVKRIADFARHLVEFRDSWLNPPDVGEAILQKRTLTNLYNVLVYYRAEVKGKYRDPKRWFSEIGQLLQLGRVRPETVITLEEIERLDYIHQQLDQAVLAAYHWPLHLNDGQILARLLALNLVRAAE